jgi:hypothetical protein
VHDTQGGRQQSQLQPQPQQNAQAGPASLARHVQHQPQQMVPSVPMPMQSKSSAPVQAQVRVGSMRPSVCDSPVTVARMIARMRCA